MTTPTPLLASGTIPVQRAEDSENRRADRFITAWKRVETTLQLKWLDKHPSVRESDVPEVTALLRWAQQHHLVPPVTEEFLHSCRHARNAYAHVAFPGYAGPVTLPPEPVVLRVERIAHGLSHPVLAHTVAEPALTCEQSTPLVQALQLMRAHDFSQLPYRHTEHGWLLVTRDQVSRWIEVHTEVDGTVLADLSVPVSQLADDPRIGPVHVAVVPADEPVARLVELLEHAYATPDSEPGGYAAVLIKAKGKPCRLLSGEDLPRLYDQLGR